MAEANRSIHRQKQRLGDRYDMLRSQLLHRDPAGMDTDAKLEPDGLVHEHTGGLVGGMAGRQGKSFKMGVDVHQARTTISLKYLFWQDCHN